MREKLLGSTDPVSSLLGFIAHGRLNANRALHSIADHFHNDIYLTGMAEAQQLVNAIDHIQAADYSVNPPYSGSFTAGESIVLYPTSIIEVDEGTSHSFIVNPDMFNCAYAYPPLSVDCIAPDYAYCDSWIYCNAAPFGGTGPYTYTWYSRLGGSSEWTTWGVTGNLMIFASNYSESFWVRVKVTDGEGVSAMSNEEFVVCIDGFIPDGTGDKIAQSGLKADDSAFSIFPNPSRGEFTLQLKGKSYFGTMMVRILDGNGRVCWQTQLTSLVDGVS